MKNNKEKTFAFIDASNIIYGILKYEGWKVDFKKLKEYLINRYQVEKIFYYAGIDNNNKKQKKFYQKIKKEFGYIPKLKKVKYYYQPDGSVVKKANCDVEMTFDIMRLLSQYNRAIILTGDGDFACVIKYLIRKKREVKIIANAKRASSDLRNLIKSEFIDIRNLKDVIKL